MTNSNKGRQTSDTGKKNSNREQPGKQEQPAKQQSGKQVRSGKQGHGVRGQDASSGQDPEKNIQIDDNPEETKRKIPQ